MSEPLEIQLPAEPCVVLWDGKDAVIVTERVLEPIRQWARFSGPLARAVMSARLRGVVDAIEDSTLHLTSEVSK